MPRDAVSRTANVERNGGHKWVIKQPHTKLCHRQTNILTDEIILLKKAGTFVISFANFLIRKKYARHLAPLIAQLKTKIYGFKFPIYLMRDLSIFENTILIMRHF